MEGNPDPQWARICSSTAFNLRTPVNAVLGWARVLELEHAGPLNEQQRKALGFLLRSAGTISGVLDHLSMLIQHCEGRRPDGPGVFELGTVVHDICSTLARSNSEGSWDVRPGDGDQHVLAVESDFRLLAAAVIQCVFFSLRNTTDLSIWVVTPATGDTPERWLVVAPSAQIERALDPGNLRPFTDDRSSSRFALETALGSRLLAANGGRFLVFHERSAGAVIALPRA